MLKEHHGLLDRHRLLLEACELNSVCDEDYIDLSKAGLGSCLLGGLPDWLIAYSARLVCIIFSLILIYNVRYRLLIFRCQILGEVYKFREDKTPW